jgi:glutathione S-transferase
VPVLVTGDGVIGQSREILAWVDRRTPPEQRLFPAAAAERAEVERLCARFDDELGPKGRRLMYVHMLADRRLALRFNNQGVPPWEDRAIRHGWPLAAGFVRRALDIRPGVEVSDEATVWREFDFVAGLLEDGRPRLCGERFGAGDLTFAAMAAAVIVPPRYGVRLPQPEQLPPAMAALVRRAREHPAGHYALSLFAGQRREQVV